MCLRVWFIWSLGRCFTTCKSAFESLGRQGSKTSGLSVIIVLVIVLLLLLLILSAYHQNRRRHRHRHRRHHHHHHHHHHDPHPHPHSHRHRHRDRHRHRPRPRPRPRPPFGEVVCKGYYSFHRESPSQALSGFSGTYGLQGWSFHWEQSPSQALLGTCDWQCFDWTESKDQLLFTLYSLKSSHNQVTWAAVLAVFSLFKKLPSLRTCQHQTRVFCARVEFGASFCQSRVQKQEFKSI